LISSEKVKGEFFLLKIFAKDINPDNDYEYKFMMLNPCIEAEDENRIFMSPNKSAFLSPQKLMTYSQVSGNKNVS
jgi:hypothetical protein